MEKLKYDILKEHKMSTKTKTVTLRHCWRVYYDTNGNAPADADVFFCASKELAHQVCQFLAQSRKGSVYLVVDATKRDKKERPEYVQFGKVIMTDPPSFSVEGYEWDCAYQVDEGWAEDQNIITSFADVACSCDSALDFEEFGSGKGEPAIGAYIEGDGEEETEEEEGS